MIYKRLNEKKVAVLCPKCKGVVTTLNVSFYVQNSKNYKIIEKHLDECFAKKNMSFCSKCNRRFI